MLSDDDDVGCAGDCGGTYRRRFPAETGSRQQLTASTQRLVLLLAAVAGGIVGVDVGGTRAVVPGRVPEQFANGIRD